MFRGMHFGICSNFYPLGALLVKHFYGSYIIRLEYFMQVLRVVQQGFHLWSLPCDGCGSTLMSVIWAFHGSLGFNECFEIAEIW